MPTVIEISKNKKPFKVDIRDPKFDRPLSELKKTFERTGTTTLITKIRLT